MNTHAAARSSERMSAVDAFCRRQLVRRLEGLVGGRVRIVDRADVVEVGDGDPTIEIVVHDERFYRRIALGGTLGAGEAYVDGDWSCEDLVGLVRLLVRNRDRADSMEGGAARLSGWLEAAAHRILRGNTVAGSRRNIAAHYDLGNALFERFLDADMQYSSALYERSDETLEQASRNKLERIVAKLELRPDDHLLEIGSGWGGLAVYAARASGCRVTTTTISREQHAYARERVEAAGLNDRVEVLLRDYRELDGRYTKLVSVEMVEAVGADHLDEYFATLGRLVVPDGLALVQAITIEDARYAQALRSVDFIKRHVFPGSFIPSVSVLLGAAATRSDLVCVNLEDLGADYARTLAEWARRFESRWREIAALGYDERFRRLWRFYLAYCEGGFRERALSDVQLLFAKPGWRGQPWRAPQPGRFRPIHSLEEGRR